MGAAFLHGAAVTIHKAQGSQWPEVQVFAPDLWAAAQAGRSEAGVPLWKRLAYVAITRAENRLHWVVRNRLALPKQPLGVDDLRATRRRWRWRRRHGPTGISLRANLGRQQGRKPMALVFVQFRCTPGKTYEVANAIWDREVVSELYSTSGEYDLIAKVYIPDGRGRRATTCRRGCSTFPASSAP
jgi:hypothetical protein